jgi:hypothetical protein
VEVALSEDRSGCPPVYWIYVVYNYIPFHVRGQPVISSLFVCEPCGSQESRLDKTQSLTSAIRICSQTKSYLLTGVDTK